MPRGRPLPPLVLSPAERGALQRWVTRQKTAQALALRARIILACAEGRSNNEVSAQVGLGSQSVGKWRRRFLDKRLDGLLDEPRTGAPRKITDADVERVAALTLETTPTDAGHWSTRSMARRSGLSQSAVSRIWRAHTLEPRRTRTFNISKNPQVTQKSP
ncbi:MAG: helix-turn-helix domain-containing protein [Candidatus Tectomicrobia bacterium]|nr:helix-turn-helix domain-containing protein [Candidatus Tectomicrobia bacterium]